MSKKQPSTDTETKTDQSSNDDHTTKDHGFVHRITSESGLLSALTAVFMVVAVPALIYVVGTGTVSLAAISGIWTWVFALIFLMAATRLFGKDTLQAVQKARGKK